MSKPKPEPIPSNYPSMNSYSHKRSTRHYHSHPASMAASNAMSPKVSTNRKNRSQPIAIQRTKSHEYVDSEEPNEYDMATWRMYHRIINHRMLQAGSASSTVSSQESEESSPLHLQHPGIVNETHMHRPFQICIQELDQLISEMEDDEGIFQFDL